MVTYKPGVTKGSLTSAQGGGGVEDAWRLLALNQKIQIPYSVRGPVTKDKVGKDRARHLTPFSILCVQGAHTCIHAHHTRTYF